MDSRPRGVKAPRVWLASGALLAVVGCTDPREHAEDLLQEIGPAALRREAAVFYKQLFVAPPGRYFVPKLSQCPPAFRRFQPREVRASADGFALALRDARGVEEGLYVVPLGMEGVPRASPNARFQKVDEGIYWFWFTD